MRYSTFILAAATAALAEELHTTVSIRRPRMEPLLREGSNGR